MRTGFPRWTLILAASAVATLAAPRAHAEEKASSKSSKVAVRAFLAKGVEASTASTIETAFCDALSKQSLEVVCSEDVKALFSMRQTDLGLGNCESEEECTKQVAKISEAGKVVTGEVSKLGDQYIVSATLIDAESSKVVGRASEKTSKLEGLLDKLDGLAKKLVSSGK
jgi:TolB-like protein